MPNQLYYYNIALECKIASLFVYVMGIFPGEAPD